MASATRDQTLLSSAARTAAVTSPAIYSHGAVGIRFDIDITAITGTTPTATFTVEAYDQAKGGYVTELVSAALAATGHTVLQVDPRVAAAANVSVQRNPTERYRVVLAVGGTSPSVTFSLLATRGN